MPLDRLALQDDPAVTGPCRPTLGAISNVGDRFAEVRAAWLHEVEKGRVRQQGPGPGSPPYVETEAAATALPRAVALPGLARGEQQVGRVALVALFRQAHVQRQAGEIGGQGFAAGVVVAIEVLEIGLAVGAGLGA